jgi:hypothetical protein
MNANRDKTGKNRPENVAGMKHRADETGRRAQRDAASD